MTVKITDPEIWKHIRAMYFGGYSEAEEVTNDDMDRYYTKQKNIKNQSR